MARKKVRLSWIKNDYTRRVTLKKRRQGLKKKVKELGILCGIPTCCVIYGPNDTAPDTWPPEKPALMPIIERYMTTPDIEKSKKSMNQDGFLRTQIEKFRDLLMKIEHENTQAKLNTLLYECVGGKSMDDLGRKETQNLSDLVDSKLYVLMKRIESMRNPISLITGRPIMNFSPGRESSTAPVGGMTTPPDPQLPHPANNDQDWMNDHTFGN